MASSAAGGYGGAEEKYMYHMPQQSRREKLRYPLDDSSFHHTYRPNPNPAPPFHHAAAPFFPSPSQKPDYNYSFCAAAPASTHQILNHQPFSLPLTPARRRQLPEGNQASVGPFTIMNRSRFFEPARQLLEEICNVGRVVQCSEDQLTLDRGPDGEMGGLVVSCGFEEQQQWKKTRLISMLDEVSRRYKLYYEQVQAVITSFESVRGLSSAAPYASMALKIMSKHFRCLKNAISDQLHHINKAIVREGFSEEEHSRFGIINRTANHYDTIRQPHVWRPQRGLPERAVAVLRGWLFEHFLHPYPSDIDKQMLAKQTGLTRNQVSNWFINARVRLWKPMIEEIHSLEMRQQNKAGTGNTDRNSGNPARLPSFSTATSSDDQPFHNTNQNNQNQSPKRPRNELRQMPGHIQEPNYSLVYDGFSGHHNIGDGDGVSLTLGLCQNNGICLAEPIPLNVARQFGLDLDECSDPCVIGSFAGQERQFEKDIGGHLLHDFVG